VLAVLTLVLAVLIWIKDKRRWLRWFGVIAVFGIVVQAVLGGEVVRQLLQYWLPVLHACFAQIVFAAVLAIAVFTSKWWIEQRPRLSDFGSPSIHTLAILNAAVIFFQVVLGAGFRHSQIPVWPHMVGALAVLGTVTWTAVAMRKRFADAPEISRARILLHSIFGLQFLLGFGAYWGRLTEEKIGPTSGTVWLTVTHTVVGAVLFALSVLIVLICFRLVPHGREAASPARREVTA
jgi:heme A synthase